MTPRLIPWLGLALLGAAQAPAAPDPAATFADLKVYSSSGT